MPFLIRPIRRLSLTYFLGFISLTALLLMSGGPACAEWVDIGYTEGDAGYTLYVDPATIRRKENRVKMWVLFDYKLVQRVGTSSLLYLSERAQQQFDCEEELTRRIETMVFSLNMTKGNQVASNTDETKWQAVAPETIGLLMWKVACGKK